MDHTHIGIPLELYVLRHATINAKWFGFLPSFSRHFQGRNMRIRKLWLLLDKVLDEIFNVIKENILDDDIVP